MNNMTYRSFAANRGANCKHVMRYQHYLIQRYRLLFGYIGAITALIGLILLVPLIVLPFYPEETAHASSFIVPGIPLIGIGYIIWRLFRPTQPTTLTLQEGAVIVIFTWAIAILAGTVPLMITSNLTFSQAVFEATSGWTTTGLSVVDVENSPAIILFYRSFIQLAGGAGFAIIALSAIAGSFSAGLVNAEGRTDQLAPHVRHSANIVLSIYTGYVVIGVVALRLAGMNWFDAVNHAFTALSTGGFSTRVASIGYWDSPLIEAVTIVLMLLGTINFVVAYTLLRRKIRAGLRSGELHLLAALLIVGFTLMLLFVTTGLYPTAEKAIRVAIFESASALTTTGFATVDYRTFPPFAWLILILFMIIGGGTGSTAGGMKQFRVYVIYKAVVWEIKKAFLPRHALNDPAIWQGESRSLLTDRQVRQTAVFIGLYLFLLVVGSGLMMIYGYSMQDSLFEFASSLGTVGLSVGVTSPDMPVPLLWIQSAGMLLGRLEIFSVLIGILKLVSDGKSLITKSA